MNIELTIRAGSYAKSVTFDLSIFTSVPPILWVFILIFFAALVFLWTWRDTRVVRRAGEAFLTGVRTVAPVGLIFVALDCRCPALLTFLYIPFGGYLSPSPPPYECHAYPRLTIITLASWVALFGTTLYKIFFTDFSNILSFPQW